MIYSVRHITQVSYGAPVAHAQFNLRLVPWPWRGQSLARHSLRLDPEPASREDSPGPYCVNTTQVSFDEPLERLEIRNEFRIETMSGPEPGDGPPVSEVSMQALAMGDLSAIAPASYLFPSRIAADNPGIGEWAGRHFSADRGIVGAARGLMRAIHEEFDYKQGVTTSDTPPAEAFRKREGVCQDFAHVMIIALRNRGIPAAYASGYLRTDPPAGEPRLVGADAMHAWVNVWCGSSLGWVGMDPTNDCLARADHIQIAMGRDYADVAPIDGTFIGTAPHRMTASVDVEVEN